MQITAETVVLFDYTLKGDDGQVLDSSTDSEPMAYLHGVGAIVPGLETALEGKIAGDELEVSVTPAEGFGVRDEALCQVVPRGHFDQIPDLSLGMRFRVPTEQGDIAVTVVELNDETVTLDGNHELAGRHLHFEVVVRDVRTATEEEVSHGHAHGPGGHDH